MTEDYKAKLEEAIEYQDFVSCQLYKLGIVIPLLGSKKYQINVGESIAGYEIKYDKQFRKTGNLYFEYMEKSNPANRDYIKGGFLREDNTWMWCIGDYRDIWLIPKRSLQRIYSQYLKAPMQMCARFSIVDRMTETSKGLTIPVTVIDNQICAKHIHIDSDSEEGQQDDEVLF